MIFQIAAPDHQNLLNIQIEFMWQISSGALAEKPKHILLLAFYCEYHCIFIPYWQRLSQSNNFPIFSNHHLFLYLIKANIFPISCLWHKEIIKTDLILQQGCKISMFGELYELRKLISDQLQQTITMKLNLMKLFKIQNIMDWHSNCVGSCIIRGTSVFSYESWQNWLKNA